MSLLREDKQLPNPAFPSSSASPPMTKIIKEKRKLEESDDDLFRVPDMETNLLDQNDEKEKNKSQGRIVSKNEGSTSSPGGATVIPPKKKRGRNPVDKEYRRIKRLLRNRVSAQQARERKKVYVSDLEWRAKELQDHNFQLEENISTLVNENSMLRKILMNTRPKLDESVETKA